jgi:hypothetical protein
MIASIEAAENPSEPVTLPSRLFAILGVWMEADVVGATVRNALTQGCERVYLVDNGSTDGTIETAVGAGAILARTFQTPRYDESMRLDHMNGVAEEISHAESDRHQWWLFLDGDEFPHGPWGMTLGDYVRTLDQRFRAVGMRCFDHFPGRMPHHAPGRHPLDVQPLCEEQALPMCPAGHRKHSLLRFDKNGPRIRAGNGFHLIECEEPVFEPAQPAFLHHFPYRNEAATRARLHALWRRDESGASRALETRDTHMLARIRSLAAVYEQDWNSVVNFIALDPMYRAMKSPPPPSGVHPKPWSETVPAEHQNVLRWYSMIDAWNYGEFEKFNYGDDTTFVRGMSFLDGHGTIEDWGCGFARGREFVSQSKYIGLDGSSQYADRIVDLQTHVTSTDCIFMRHVLEHNPNWRTVLANALASFTRRMVLVVFTPFGETTRVIATTAGMTAIPVPDISFRKSDVTQLFGDISYREESLATDTQYGIEHVFYLEKPGSAG